MRHLKTLLGDYPVTAALKANRIRSPNFTLDFADVKPPSAAFKRVVRDLEFDVAELAIVTFLLAKAAGKPLLLLPAVVVARFQHPLLVYNAERKKITADDLAGKRIGVRSYSVTTGAWLRWILAESHHLDPATVDWITFEEAHVAEFVDPPNVQRAPEGAKLIDMLLAGEIDAAIVGDGMAPDPRIQPVLEDPAAAAAEWQRRHVATQINHMVVVREDLPREDAREVYEMLRESRERAPVADMTPFGLEQNRRNLEAAIECVWGQGMIPNRFTVDELFGGNFP